MPEKLIIDTSKGKILAELNRDNGVLQFNAFSAPGGVAFFMVFADGPGQKEAIEAAARDLIEGEPLEPGANISSRVPGCIAAGTAGRLHVTFGAPGVSAVA